jgi:hypothetical protein
MNETVLVLTLMSLTGCLGVTLGLVVGFSRTREVKGYQAKVSEVATGCTNSQKGAAHEKPVRSPRSRTD